jgi:hypothetical protein
MEHDLEKDLLNSQYIKEKCTNDTYAQNLYAALCNNEFTKNEVVPILKEEVWTLQLEICRGLSSSNTRECGTILIGTVVELTRGWNNDEPDDWDETGFMPEGCVTDEIRNDLLHINWTVCVDNEQNR